MEFKDKGKPSASFGERLLSIPAARTAIALMKHGNCAQVFLKTNQNIVSHNA